MNTLYFVVNSYRSPNKTKDIPVGQNAWHNFKINDAGWGKPHNMDAQGNPLSVLIDGKWIVPYKFVREATPEEIVLNTEKKNNMDGAETSTATVKIKDSIENIKTLSNSYTSTGVFVGVIVGLGVATYLKKGIWVSAAITILGGAAGAYIGNQLNKKYAKV